MFLLYISKLTCVFILPLLFVSVQLITDMDTPQYSLRWNNHLVHMMDAIEVLLQNETLVDVTLVCENTQFKAHKVVLSASRYIIFIYKHFYSKFHFLN